MKPFVAHRVRLVSRLTSEEHRTIQGLHVFAIVESNQVLGVNSSTETGLRSLSINNRALIGGYIIGAWKSFPGKPYELML
jgi:hypothetical protein